MASANVSRRSYELFICKITAQGEFHAVGSAILAAFSDHEQISEMIFQLSHLHRSDRHHVWYSDHEQISERIFQL